MLQIWPSLISADILNLASVIDRLNPHCFGWHLDVMDNHFVPNLTWGAMFMNAIHAYSNKPAWIHLMIDSPEQFVDLLEVPHQGSYITFHIETTSDIEKTIQIIRAKGFHVGIALKPQTSIERVMPYIDMIDQLLVMSVNPGFSGQMFIEETLDKINTLQYELLKRKMSVVIASDGGVNRDNISKLAHLGVQQFAIASGIFGATDMVAELNNLYSLLEHKQ